MVETGSKLQDMLRFVDGNLTATLAKIESSFVGLAKSGSEKSLLSFHADSGSLSDAAYLKGIAGEVNVVIHALGILRCLPHILESDESIEYLSLGAGNTGRKFDLETNKRVAEFKFIHWQGGPESIRQNSIFKDYYDLASYPGAKRRVLYVLGTQFPLKFFQGGRAIGSVLSKNDKLKTKFSVAHGERYKTVRDYYTDHKHLVEIVDVSRFLPELVGLSPAT